MPSDQRKCVLSTGKRHEITEYAPRWACGKIRILKARIRALTTSQSLHLPPKLTDKFIKLATRHVEICADRKHIVCL